jgi:hypothetical protein
MTSADQDRDAALYAILGCFVDHLVEKGIIDPVQVGRCIDETATTYAQQGASKAAAMIRMMGHALLTHDESEPPDHEHH